MKNSPEKKQRNSIKAGQTWQLGDHRLLYGSSLDELNIYFSQLVIWVKNHAVIGRKDYLPQHELIVVGWYGTHAFRRSKDKSVLCYPKPHKSTRHPTQKPIPLVRHL